MNGMQFALRAEMEFAALIAQCTECFIFYIVSDIKCSGRLYVSYVANAYVFDLSHGIYVPELCSAACSMRYNDDYM